MKTLGRQVRYEEGNWQRCGGGALGNELSMIGGDWVIISLHFSAVDNETISIKAGGRLNGSGALWRSSHKVTIWGSAGLYGNAAVWGSPTFCKSSLIHVPEVSPVNSLVHQKVKERGGGGGERAGRPEWWCFLFHKAAPGENHSALHRGLFSWKSVYFVWGLVPTCGSQRTALRSLLAFYHVSPGNWTRVSPLGANHLTQWAEIHLKP